MEFKNPYNFNNKLINKHILLEIINKYNIKDINNIKLYQQAFTHKSYNKLVTCNYINKPEGAVELQDSNNERFEFLGDSILNVVVAQYLFDRYPSQNEGFLTKLRTKLVNGDALAYFSKELGFGKYILLSKNIEDNFNGRNQINILEDVFESFIGALYIDFQNNKVHESFYSGIGFQTCQKFIINLIEDKIDFEQLINTDTNYKQQLLKYMLETSQTSISYKYNTSTIDNNKHFIVDVINNKTGDIIARGEGKTKKKAEQNGSKNSLLSFGII